MRIKSFVLRCKKTLPVLLLVGCCFLGGCGGASDSVGQEAQTNITTQSVTEAEVIVEKGPMSQDLYCLEFSAFSGVFVENGENEDVHDVAAILVENRSEAFLDRAVITYKYDDKDAVFLLTGLPAGEKCWVMEQNKLQIDGKYEFEFSDCVSAFDNDAIETSEHLTVDATDNVLEVTNTSDKTLKNVCVYYKNTFDDGNYFGGITYMLSFGELSPAQTAQKASAHFSDKSEIVKFSYQM